MKRSLTYLAAAALVAAGSAAASAAPGTGPHWIVQPTPNRAAPSNMLAAVSCTSGSFCMAVGTSGPMEVLLADGTGRPPAASAPRSAAKPLPTRTLAERWDGAHWKIVPTPNPAGSSATFLNGVTCSSRRACTAVGSAVAGKITVPLVERWDGSRWSVVKSPRPPGATFGTLAGVSCPTSRECVAVGSEFNAAIVVSGFAEHWNGSRWTLAGKFRLGANAFLSSVSCSSATRCTAVGAHESTTTAFPLAERWIAGQWHRQATPGTGTLDGVSCPAFSHCTAVGGQANESAVLAMQWNGSSWKRQAIPEPQGAKQGFLLGVSCPAVTSCEAVGWATLATTVTVADHWNGTNWRLEPTPALTGTLIAEFNGVWCGAQIACRAAGNVQLPSPSGDQTLVERR